MYEHKYTQVFINPQRINTFIYFTSDYTIVICNDIARCLKAALVTVLLWFVSI